LDKLDFISGDFDSHKIEEEIIRQAQNDSFEIIETPDQNKTDFHKALEFISKKDLKILMFTVEVEENKTIFWESECSFCF
jgi:thiamine pyrophosphokinase